MLRLPRKGAGTFDQTSKGESFEVEDLAEDEILGGITLQECKRGHGLDRHVLTCANVVKHFDSKKAHARLRPHTAVYRDYDQGPLRQSTGVR